MFLGARYKLGMGAITRIKSNCRQTINRLQALCLINKVLETRGILVREPCLATINARRHSLNKPMNGLFCEEKKFTATNIYERGELSINAKAGCSGTLRIQSDACSGV